MSWKDVWHRKGNEAPAVPTVADLMYLNGYDSGAGYAEQNALDNFAAVVGARLDVRPDMRLLEVGCGAGAWLRHHYLNGMDVSGADFSLGHLNVARQIMPRGNFANADATYLPYRSEIFDITIAGSCFLYLPDPQSAEDALTELIRVLKAGGRGAVTDLPDAALRREAEITRRGALGPDQYDRRYSGLDHQYFSRTEMVSLCARLGVTATTSTQEIAGYGNSPYRFNLWFEKL